MFLLFYLTREANRKRIERVLESLIERGARRHLSPDNADFIVGWHQDNVGVAEQEGESTIKVSLRFLLRNGPRLARRVRTRRARKN